MNQVQASKERFEHFNERDVALLRWRFGKGYVAELAERRYRKMFVGAKRILDVGCGVGEAAQWANGADYYGIDISNILVCEGIKRQNRYLAVANVTNLPFQDETFDRVTCMGLLHHLPKQDITLALQEMIRVLEVGGRIAIVEPNPWNIYQRLFAYIRSAERGILNTSPHNLRHIIQSVGGVEIEKFEYDHTMFWPSYFTFILRRWVWPISVPLTSLFLLLHRIVRKLTPDPLCSHTFWKLRKIA